MDYKKILSHFVEEKYLEVLTEEGLEAAGNHIDRGGSHYVATAIGIYESTDRTLEKIASELDVTRRAIYNGREEQGLEIRERED